MEKALKQVVLKAQGIQKALLTISREIMERHPSLENVVLIGIRTGGAYLAYRIQKQIKILAGYAPRVGILDINLYRDDWTRISQMPVVGKTEINISLTNKEVILIDDVLYTGRTVRAAMDALMDFGRPSQIELAVLVDRGHRELPIAPQYVGIVQKTQKDEKVNVYLREMGNRDQVTLEPIKAQVTGKT